MSTEISEEAKLAIANGAMIRARGLQCRAARSVP
jgi:hypothetical protein